MKTLIHVIFGTICSTSFVAAEATTRPLTAAEARLIETNYNKLVGGSQSWELQKDQTFETELNSGKLKNVVFAPFKNNNIQFTLLTREGRSIVQMLPKSDLAVVDIFSFLRVDAVSFTDTNGDGTRDILVLATYFDSRPVQGDGVGGGTTKVGFGFISNNDEFVLDNTCGGDVANLKDLEKCLRGKRKK